MYGDWQHPAVVGLVVSQPVADLPSKLSDAFDPADAGCQFRTQPTAFSRFIGQTPDRREL
jgi:hypothetical protein